MEFHLFRDKQPAIGVPVYRVMFRDHALTLVASSLENFYPMERLPGEPPIPEPLVGWFQGKFPRPADVWTEATPDLVATLEGVRRASYI